MRKDNIIEIMGIMVLACFLGSCVKEKGEHRFITFVNNSADTLYVSMNWQIEIELSDTLCDCRAGFTRVFKGDSCQFSPSNNYWETDFKAIPFIQFFVFPASIFTYSEGTRKFAHSSCEETRAYQLKRYQLTEADLDSLNWTITYP